MKEFTALLSKPDSANPAEQQKHLSARLAEALKNSRLNFWKMGDNIPSVGRRVLVGVAPYSIYDLKLLDALNELPQDTTSDRIDIFDVVECHSQDDFDKYIPGIGRVYDTPVAGVWRNGELDEKRSGHSARMLIMKLYGLDETRLR